MGNITGQRDLFYMQLQDLKETLYEALKIVSAMTPIREASIVNDARELREQLEYIRLLTRQYEMICETFPS